MDKREVLKRGYAETMEEWWFLYNDRADDLQTLMRCYLPKEDLEQAQKYIARRNATGLWLSLQKLWHRLPDTPAVQSMAGFHRLCDLCSDFPTKKEIGE